MTLDDLWGNTLFNEKVASSLWWDSWKVFKRLGVKKKITEKDDFEILRWPYETFNDLWDHT